MIAVNGGRDGSSSKTRGDELKNSHLSGGILHSHAVRAELQVRLTTLDGFGGIGVVQVRIDNLLSKGERAVAGYLADNSQVASELVVRDEAILLELSTKKQMNTLKETPCVE